MTSFHRDLRPITNLVRAVPRHILGRRSCTASVVKRSNTSRVESGIFVSASSVISVHIGLMKCEKCGRSIDYCNVLFDRQSHQVVIIRRSPYDNVLYAVPREVVESNEEIVLGVCGEQFTTPSGRLGHVFRQVQQRVVA